MRYIEVRPSLPSFEWFRFKIELFLFENVKNFLEENFMKSKNRLFSPCCSLSGPGNGVFDLATLDGTPSSLMLTFVPPQWIGGFLFSLISE